MFIEDLKIFVEIIGSKRVNEEMIIEYLEMIVKLINVLLNGINLFLLLFLINKIK